MYTKAVPSLVHSSGIAIACEAATPGTDSPRSKEMRYRGVAGDSDSVASGLVCACAAMDNESANWVTVRCMTHLKVMIAAGERSLQQEFRNECFSCLFPGWVDLDHTTPRYLSRAL